jgi:putative endonuclease
MLNDYIYILASRGNGTLYIGKTNDLKRRIYEHKHDMIDGFTKKYGVRNLVYYEVYDDHENAALRELRMKQWKRKWKLALIDSYNPDWADLYERL